MIHCDSVEIDFFKCCTVFERMLADACDAVSNCHARKACATIERIIADACDTIANYNARKAGATRERMIMNLIIISVVVFGKRKRSIISYVAKKIVDTGIGIE
jgi:hypothetical protein